MERLILDHRAEVRPRRLADFVSRCLAALVAADARRRDAARLASLPDYLLADMALTRDAVRSHPPVLGG
jgi:uncharacterized protein YjiS (DUF1127 family)